MHTKNVVEYVCFKASLYGRKLSTPFKMSRVDDKGVEYTDDIMELPKSLNFSQIKSTFAIHHLPLPSDGFRYLKLS